MRCCVPLRCLVLLCCWWLTRMRLLQNYGCSDPTSFFWQLSGKPYLGNVVISPHVYPPSVSFATQVRLGGLWACMKSGPSSCLSHSVAAQRRLQNCVS